MKLKKLRQRWSQGKISLTIDDEFADAGGRHGDISIRQRAPPYG